MITIPVFPGEDQPQVNDFLAHLVITASQHCTIALSYHYKYTSLQPPRLQTFLILYDHISANKSRMKKCWSNRGATWLKLFLICGLGRCLCPGSNQPPGHRWVQQMFRTPKFLPPYTAVWDLAGNRTQFTSLGRSVPTTTVSVSRAVVTLTKIYILQHTSLWWVVKRFQIITNEQIKIICQCPKKE